MAGILCFSIFHMNKHFDKNSSFLPPISFFYFPLSFNSFANAAGGYSAVLGTFLPPASPLSAAKLVSAASPDTNCKRIGQNLPIIFIE
jgi:hypothetical protein